MKCRIAKSFTINGNIFCQKINSGLQTPDSNNKDSINLPLHKRVEYHFYNINHNLIAEASSAEHE